MIEPNKAFKSYNMPSIFERCGYLDGGQLRRKYDTSVGYMLTQEPANMSAAIFSAMRSSQISMIFAKPKQG